MPEEQTPILRLSALGRRFRVTHRCLRVQLAMSNLTRRQEA